MPVVELAVALAGVLVPSGGLFRLLWVRLGRGRQTLESVLQVFFISFLTTLPAGIINTIVILAIAIRGGISLDGGGELSQLNFRFAELVVLCISVGLTEEGVKYWFLRRRALRRLPVFAVRDAVLFGGLVGLAFATVENSSYISAAMVQGFGPVAATVLARAVAAVPGHTAAGIVMGWYAGLARERALAGKGRDFSWRAYLIPAAAHALYDFFAFAGGLQLGGQTVAIAAWVGLAAVVLIEWWVILLLTGRVRRRPLPDGGGFLTGRPAPSPPYPFPGALPPGGGYAAGMWYPASAGYGPPSGAAYPPPAGYGRSGRFCVQCGRPSERGDILCLACGAAWQPPPSSVASAPQPVYAPPLTGPPDGAYPPALPSAHPPPAGAEPPESP